MIFKRKFLISSLIILILLIVFLLFYNFNFQKLNVNFENYLSKETFCTFKVIDSKKENNNLTLYL